MGGGRCHVFMYEINRKGGHREVGTRRHEEAGLMNGSEVFVCGAEQKIVGAFKLLSLPDTLQPSIFFGLIE